MTVNVRLILNLFYQDDNGQRKILDIMYQMLAKFKARVVAATFSLGSESFYNRLHKLANEDLDRIFKYVRLWDYTKEKLENFKTHGTIEITKDSRKNRKKKIDQNYVYDMKNKESERKTKQQQSDLTEQQKEKKEESPRLLEKVVSEMKKSSIMYSDEEDDKDDSFLPDLKTPIHSRAFNSNVKLSNDDEDVDESDDDDQMVKTLEAKDEEIERLETLIKTYKEKISNLENDIKSKNEKINSLEERIEHEKIDANFNNDVLSMIDYSERKMNNIIQDAQKVLSNFKSLKTRKRTANDTVDEEVELKISKPSTNNKLKKEGSTKATEDKKKKTVGVRLTMDPTNYTLSEKDKAGLPRKDISEYTIAILNRLFSPDELLNSSVTRKPANYNPDAPVRPGLSPNRLHAARSNLPLILLL
uniref:BEN domain-containing protein n=1 Tax=Trichogramma kaykai TaxID=54128 RepID=A0ABD2X1X9_9HYME